MEIKSYIIIKNVCKSNNIINIYYYYHYYYTNVIKKNTKGVSSCNTFLATKGLTRSGGETSRRRVHPNSPWNCMPPHTHNDRPMMLKISKKNSLTLQGINISHLGKRKIIFKMPFLGGYVSSLEGILVSPNLPLKKETLAIFLGWNFTLNLLMSAKTSTWHWWNSPFGIFSRFRCDDSSGFAFGNTLSTEISLPVSHLSRR